MKVKMNTIPVPWKSVIAYIDILFFILFFMTGDFAAARVSSAESPAPAACATAAYRQFDFWAGDWDVFDIGSPAKVAHARVDLILDGCVLHENYEGADGHKGQSFTIYDAARKVWHQSWVTNRGQLLIIEGKIEAGEMVLSGEDHATGALVRGTWRPVNGGVRETAVTSTDNGKTWKPWFDLLFRPAATDKTGPTAVNEGQPVSALDTEYQAAVQRNDADAVDRILADDFVLVTGSEPSKWGCGEDISFELPLACFFQPLTTGPFKAAFSTWQIAALNLRLNR